MDGIAGVAAVGASATGGGGATGGAAIRRLALGRSANVGPLAVSSSPPAIARQHSPRRIRVCQGNRVETDGRRSQLDRRKPCAG
jgi:hypothetical protein